MNRMDHDRRVEQIRNKRRKRKVKIFSGKMRTGLMIVFFVVIFTFLFLMGRLYYLNVKDGDRYKKKVLSQQTYMSNVLPYKRGEIRDRNATTMATSVRVFDLVIDPSTLLGEEECYEPTLNAITEVLGVTREDLEEAINKKPDSQYVKIKSAKELSADVVAPFYERMEEDKAEYKKNNKKAGSLIKGVWFEEKYTRKYPLGTVGSHVIGFSNDEDMGALGLESSYNDTLNGTNGREYGYFDSELNLERTVKPARNGDSIVSTLDANVQRIVEEKMAKWQNEVGSKNMAVMLANPQTGEIYAMASNKEFDLNKPRDLTPFFKQEEIDAMSEEDKVTSLNEIWKNFCISNTYEPGSTFKPFTVAAALDEAVVKDSDKFICDGVENVSGIDIHCVNRTGHGELTLSGSLEQSCNDALMEIGKRLGSENFYRYTIEYGFGSKTGIDLPAEEIGIIHAKEDIGPTELATSSFGQTQNVTMIQMMAGFCSLINDGNYYKPHLVKEIVNEQGAVVQSMEPELIKQTVSRKTSKLIREYLYQTVERGTASGAKVEGYEICGKTGTAEKHTGTEEDVYLVSFLGFTPKNNPSVAIYVTIDEPNVADQAHSSYATEFASVVLKATLPFLDIYPTDGTVLDTEDAITDVDDIIDGSTSTDDSQQQTTSPSPATSEQSENASSPSASKEPTASASPAVKPSPNE